MSLIKGGRLLGQFKGRDARVYAFSDPAAGERALLAADVGSYFKAHGELFRTGRTDTNVVDLAIALVQ